MVWRRTAEVIVVGAAGGLIAGTVGSLVDLTVPLAIVGAANGAFGGWRRIYEWSHPSGFLAFALDSTWGLVMTAAGLFANAVGVVMPGSGYVASLSERQNRHVYRRGFTPRRGYAITLGNVICGAGDVERERRRRLVTDHEDVHCWQARWWGPLYPLLYVGWTVLAGAWGAVVWLFRRRDQSFFRVVESCAYYLNPFEWWAYSRDDYWPPKGKVADLGWKRPCCRPLSQVRFDRAQ